MVPLLKKSLLYVYTKAEYSESLAWKKQRAGQIKRNAVWDTMFRNVMLGKMTYLYRIEGQEMAPTILGKQDILLIWNLPWPFAEKRLNWLQWYRQHYFSKIFGPVRTKLKWRYAKVSVGDVVLVRSPLDPNSYLARRLAALGAQEMVSAGAKAETFTLEKGHCWLLSDNQNLKEEEAKDSRTFGPVPVTEIVGRIIYRFETANNHGIVANSELSSAVDSAILELELNLNEMERCSEQGVPR